MDTHELDFRRIIDDIAGLIFVMTEKGEVEFINRQALDYFGKTLTELQDWANSDAVHPDDLSNVITEWFRAVETEQPFDSEYRLRRADGVYRWFRVRALPARDSTGHILRWYCLKTDIDDRRRAESLLACEKQLLEMIASGRLLHDVLITLCRAMEEAAPGCYCCVQTIDWRGPVFEYSVAPSLLASYSSAIAGLTVSDEMLPCAIAARQRIQVVSSDIETDSRWRTSPVRTRLVKHGVRSVCSTPICSNDGPVLGTLFIVQRSPEPLSPYHQSLIAHATHIASIAIERSRTEADLRRSKALLAEGQQLSSTGSFSWCVDADEIAFSDELYRIFEFEPNAVVTLEQVRARVHPEDVSLLSSQMARIRAGHDYLGYDMRLCMPDGRIKYLRTFGRAIRHQDGQMECLAAVQDVTERRLADEALTKARCELAHVTRVSSLNALTAAIAHEVNQPLSGIITNASTCLRMLAADPPNLGVAQETVRRTIRDGNRAADVIARLRVLFSKRVVSTEQVDLNNAVRDVIALQRSDLQQSRAVLRTELARSLPFVSGDRVQIQQVIMNLLRNAIDAMSSVDDRARQLLIRTEADNDGEVRLSVKDVGVGFGPDDTERLFEPFYTTKSDGMGMGLSVSRFIIESHRGRLWAAANDGPGVTFSFSIPTYSNDETSMLGAAG